MRDIKWMEVDADDALLIRGDGCNIEDLSFTGTLNCQFQVSFQEHLTIKQMQYI
jgi:hypothetical protein